MQKFLGRLFPWQIKWKGILLESSLFLVAYVLWLIFRSPDAPSRALVGSLAVLIPSVAAAVLVFWSLAQIPAYSRNAWRFLGLGLVFWSLGNAVRTFFELVRGVILPTLSLADAFNFIAYPLIFYALVLYPFEDRYAPSRFRFIMDAIILSGVVASLGWLILARSLPSLDFPTFAPLIYPIADLILLMILFNMLLANRKARRTLLLWGGALFAMLVSDYVYSTLAPLGGYQVGGPESLGWTLGGLIFGVGAVVESTPAREEKSRRSFAFDLGVRIQNVLPVTFVLVLVWYVVVDWRMSDRLSIPGLWMGALLTVALVVRIGVRAGEAELQKYWQLFSSLAEPTFICDGRGKILLGNPALLRALGFQEEHQIVGKPLTVIFDDQTLPVDLLEKAVRKESSCEVFLRPHRTPYLLSLSPIFSDSRKVLIAGAAHNLSDQKHQQEVVQKAYDELQELHRRLAEMNVQLEQKVEERTQTLSDAYKQLEEQNKILQELDQLKSDFVSMVSHELRTPLTSLTGGLELLLGHSNHSAADRSTITLMLNEAQRLTRFVENILNLSAIEAGRFQLHPVPLFLPALLKNVRRKFDAIPGAERITYEFPEDLPPVVADESILESILNHLLDNALKYAPEGPVVLDVIRERGRVQVRVMDSGPGIPDEKRHLLFRRFQRLDARDSQSVYGYGIGLYLSQRMLRAMHSDLEFRASPQGGAQFAFHLKVAR